MTEWYDFIWQKVLTLTSWISWLHIVHQTVMCQSKNTTIAVRHTNLTSFIAQFWLFVAYKVIRSISTNRVLRMTKRCDFGLRDDKFSLVLSAKTKWLCMTKYYLTFHFVCQSKSVTDDEMFPPRLTKCSNVFMRQLWMTVISCLHMISWEFVIRI